MLTDPNKQGEAGEFVGNPADDAEAAHEEADDATNALLEKQWRKATKDAENLVADDAKETEDAINNTLFGSN